MSDTRSYITILRPRDTSYGGSARITTDFLYYIGQRQNNQWRNRKEFFLVTLVLCLNLGSLWRFPKQLLLFGSGSFLLLYVVFTFLVANSLVFFEIALGQYSSKGFAKVFSMCPIFEGISCSMVSYCLLVSIFYNFINVTSFTYFYSSFYPVLPYENCAKEADNCLDNSTLTNSPEFIFFYQKVLSFHSWSVIGKNVGVVVLLWILVCIAIMRGMKAVEWIPVIYCPIAYIVLIIVLAGTYMTEGAWTGLRHMFLPSTKELFKGNTWWLALEQSILNLCLGMGPLITYGSYSRFQSPAHKDGFYLSCAITLISILSGMVIFGAVGILATESGQDVEDKIMEYKKYIGIHTGIIYSQLFTRIPHSVQHLLAILFFLLHTFAGWYSMISYIELFNYALISGRFQKNTYCRITTNAVVCLLCVSIGSLLYICGGDKYMEALDKYFLALSLLIIIVCELIAVIYIFGVFELCDDIEFMLGFYPNIYYQVTWIGTPVLLVIAIGYRFYDFTLQTFSTPDIVMACMVLVFIVSPILLQMIYNLIVAIMTGGLTRILNPREAILDESNDTALSLYAQSAPPSTFTPLSLMHL